MVFPAELLAIAAAACYAVNGLIAAGVRGQVSVSEFTILQLAVGSIFTAALGMISAGWSSIQAWQLPYLFLSGVTGPMWTALAITAAIFSAGPRLAALLFSANVPFTAVLAFVLLGESITLGQGVGMLVVCVGIIVALRPDETSAAGVSQPPATASYRVSAYSVFCGLTAALSQSVGSIVVRPVMAAGADAFAATALRTASAAMLLYAAHSLATLSLRIHWSGNGVLLAVSMKAIFGVVLGMTLLLAALSSGKVAVVATLSSVAPVLILPMAWAWQGKRPVGCAWLGAALTVLGSSLVTDMWQLG